MNTIIVLTFTGIIVLLLGISTKKHLLVSVISVLLLAAIGVVFLDPIISTERLLPMLSSDSLSNSFTVLMLVLALFIFFIADHYFLRRQKTVEDVYSVMIFSLIGAVILTMFNNMVMFFIGLEIMSVSLYILTGSKKNSSRSNEASMKYFLMGTFSTSVMLFGIALIYGASGSFDLTAIGNYTVANKENLPLFFKAGLILLTVAMSFKIAAAPFHFWTPDVYHGAPTLITTYMATIVKIAGVIAFYRLYVHSFAAVEDLWTDLLAFLAVPTILIGNLGAIYQTRVKRMLAYSSIAHSGYIMLALISVDYNSFTSIFYYLMAYSIASIGSFIALMLVTEVTKDGSVSTFNGLAKKNPLISLLVTLSLFSLAGLPPLAGFMAKYFIFIRTIETGYLWLAIIAIIGSAISIVYYFKIVVAMYLGESKDIVIPLTNLSKVLMAIIAILIVLLGIFPEQIISLL